MGALNRLLEAARHWNFSILGSVYLWPGHFVKLDGLSYLIVLFSGAVWMGFIALLGWFFLRPRLRASMRGGDRKAAVTLSLGIWCIYLLSGAFVTFSYPPTTDEPHYLLITESLVSDGDLELSGNYRNADFAKFYPSREIDPHAVITPDGRMYSQHTAGLPFIIAPAYALGGRWGVLFPLSLMSAALAGLLYLLCRRSGAGQRASMWAAVAAALTVPLAPASTLVFTEAPAAMLCAIGLLTCGTGWIPAACGVAMPWLHPRFALLAAGLAVLDLVCAGKRGKTAAAWGILGAISGTVFLAVYNGPSLTSILNVLTEKYPARLEDITPGALASISFANPVAGALAKLFDRDFGLFVWSPWTLVLIPGLALAWGKRGFPHSWFLVGAGLYAVVTCLFRNWHGSAFPGRTLVPLLPFAVPYLAFGVVWALEKPVRRRVLVVLTGVSMAVTAILTACPVLKYGSGRVWLAAKAGRLAGMFSWLPSFFGHTSHPAWISGILLIVAVAWAFLSRRRRTG